MGSAPSQRRTARHTDFTARQRREVLNLVSDYLREGQLEADLRPDSEAFGRRQRLHRQPWRSPRRPSFAPLSVMEIIRRYEASHGAN
jgi:hypothetical protein